MMKLIHVVALVASLFDHDAHAHNHDADHIDLILGHLNSRRAIVR